MRVSQLDSHLLDQELFTLLNANVESALGMFSTTAALSTLAKAALRAVIWKIGIWDHSNTYGSQLQSLRYLDLTPPKKIVLGLVTVLGPVLQERLGGEIQGRWRKIVAYAEGLYEVLALANFVSYIAGARYDSVLHRVLRIRLTPTTSAHRAVSFEFLNRQLIWSQFTEFLLVFLPLLRLPRLKRKLAGYLPQPESQKLGFLPRRICAICYSDAVEGADIVNPYEADCGDLFCYACVVSQIKLAEGEGWDCLRCGHRVTQARPWREVDERVGDENAVRLLRADRKRSGDSSAEGSEEESGSDASDDCSSDDDDDATRNDETF